MSQQGYVAAPPYSQAQSGMGGYQGGFGSTPAQPLYGHYGGAPPPPGKTHFKFAPRTLVHIKIYIYLFLNISLCVCLLSQVQ